MGDGGIDEGPGMRLARWRAGAPAWRARESWLHTIQLCVCCGGPNLVCKLQVEREILLHLGTVSCPQPQAQWKSSLLRIIGTQNKGFRLNPTTTD